METTEIMLYFEKKKIQMQKNLNHPLFSIEGKMTKQQINQLAMSLNFPFDHSKQEVQNLDKLFELVVILLTDCSGTCAGKPAT